MSEESDKWREHKYNEAWDALDYFADYTERRLGTDVEDICLCGGFARRDFGERRPEKIYGEIREYVPHARHFPKQFPPEYSRITDDELDEIGRIMSKSHDTADFVRRVDEKLGGNASSIVKRERYSDIDGFVAVGRIPKDLKPNVIGDTTDKGNKIIKGKFELDPFEPEFSIQSLGMPSEGCVCRHRSDGLNKSKWEER